MNGMGAGEAEVLGVGFKKRFKGLRGGGGDPAGHGVGGGVGGGRLRSGNH